VVTPLDTSGGNSAAKAQHAFAAFFVLSAGVLNWYHKRFGIYSSKR
jgi:hypothetical protein